MSYGNACGSNDGHGDSDGTALPRADPSARSDADADSAPTDASPNCFALCADGLDRGYACCEGVGYDLAVYVGRLYPSWPGYDRHGFHDNNDRWASSSTIGRHDAASDLRRSYSGTDRQNPPAVLPNCHDRWLILRHSEFWRIRLQFLEDRHQSQSPFRQNDAGKTKS